MSDFASPDLRVMRAMNEMQKNRDQKANTRTVSEAASKPKKPGTNDILRKMGVPDWKIEKMSRADRRHMAKEGRRKRHEYA